MANAWGKVLDQANIIKKYANDVDVSVIKATRHKMGIPKEKHVRKLILLTHERGGPIGQTVHSLLKRLEQPDWIIVLKTLCVFHRLFKDGNPRFIEDLKWRGTIFPLSRFTDFTTPEAHEQSIFVRKYSQYLEEKVVVYRELKMEFEKDPSVCKGMSVDDAFARLPKLQRQFDALLNCQTTEVTNPIVLHAHEMLIKDSFKLYRALNDGVITILETYFSMDRRSASKALEIYKAFMRETSAIIAFYDESKRRFTIELPELKHAPVTLVTALEEYVKDLEEGRTPTVSQSGLESLKEGANNIPSPAVVTSPPIDNSNLIDGFDHVSSPSMGSHYQNSGSNGQMTNPFDPFGVASNNQNQQSPQSTHNPSFDPFGNDPFTSPPATASFGGNKVQTTSGNFDPFSAMVPVPVPSSSLSSPSSSSSPQPPAGSSYGSSNPFNPFGSTTTSNPQGLGYNEKAANILAVFQPPPMAPTPSANNPFAQPTPSPSTQFPKPNYNVNLFQQPPPAAMQPINPGQMIPYGMQFPPQQQPAMGNQMMMGNPNPMLGSMGGGIYAQQGMQQSPKQQPISANPFGGNPFPQQQAFQQPVQQQQAFQQPVQQQQQQQNQNLNLFF